MPTAKKTATVDEIKQKLTGSTAVILTDYRGLTVKEMQALRAKLREAGGEVKVYKNTLTEMALRELALPAMDELLQGPTLFTFSTGDPVTPAKALRRLREGTQAARGQGRLHREPRGRGRRHQGVGFTAVARGAHREAARNDAQSRSSGLVRVMNGPAGAIARVLRADRRPEGCRLGASRDEKDARRPSGEARNEKENEKDGSQQG